MRVPLSKVYRAFPELDRFDDSRCEAYLRTVRRAEGGMEVLLVVVRLFIGVMTTIGLMILMGHLLTAFSTSESVFKLVIFVLLTVAFPVVAGCCSALTMRDRRLRRLLKKQIGESKCPGCGYLLLGLIPREGNIRCPECGVQHSLNELGLTAEELIEPMSG